MRISEKTAAERVALARHPQRPTTRDYIEAILMTFSLWPEIEKTGKTPAF